jgi:hypothetical protein
MRATIFLTFLCSFFFCKGENFTVNRAHSCSTQTSLTQTFFLQNQGLTGNDNQYNKISEESDTAEDHVNSDDTSNKFAPLNLESTHKWYVTNSNFFYVKEKSKDIKNFQSFFGFSQPIYIIIRVLRI